MTILQPILYSKRVFAHRIAYPLAMWYEGRHITAKERWLRTELSKPTAERLVSSRKALARKVELAGERVPYYRDLFASLRFNPARLEDDPDYLNELPCLTKDIILEQGERMLREDRRGLRRHECRTSGSTGRTVSVIYDQEAADWSAAITRYARAHIGKKHDMSEIHFASRFTERFPIRDRMREQVKCFAMNRSNIFYDDLSPDSIERIWRQLKAKRAKMVHAHPSTIYQIALHVRENHGPSHAFDIFESSGETLQAYQRAAIEQVLTCRVVDRYGLAEFGVVAYQLENRAWLNVLDPFVWPQVLPMQDTEETGMSRTKGCVGELVLTALRNEMMPLIRYRTGDIVDLGREDSGFVFHNVLGRVHDLISFGGKTIATHYIQDVLDRVGNIDEFQIDLADTEPVLRLVAAPGVQKRILARRVQSVLGHEFKIEFIDSSGLRMQGSLSKFRHVVRQ